jgi:hypothetical protein
VRFRTRGVRSLQSVLSSSHKLKHVRSVVWNPKEAEVRGNAYGCWTGTVRTSMRRHFLSEAKISDLGPPDGPAPRPRFSESAAAVEVYERRYQSPDHPEFGRAKPCDAPL